MLASLIILLAAVVASASGEPGLTHNAPRFRRGRSLAGSHGKLTFHSDWDSASNSDAKTMTKSDVYTAIYTNCDSESFQEAVDCGFTQVFKGCHQPGAKEHITVKFMDKCGTKKCKENLYCGTKTLHVKCNSCEIVST